MDTFDGFYDKPDNQESDQLPNTYDCGDTKVLQVNRSQLTFVDTFEGKHYFALPPVSLDRVTDVKVHKNNERQLFSRGSVFRNQLICYFPFETDDHQQIVLVPNGALKWRDGDKMSAFEWGVGKITF